MNKYQVTPEEIDALMSFGLEKICADDYSIKGKCMINGQMNNGESRSCIYYQRIGKIDICNVEVKENEF